ncbi:hypothetical protein RclHR1_14970008 [Rhizophagus clarus]|uniref:Uncharacterized protein n=1 Tax=Rhizophagus clarus TaxID=94130 RepID=A0A2Z6QFT3_9GLOM|nr:hypothetical protein RclHR1_14970008 [Rhizophagus clarus]
MGCERSSSIFIDVKLHGNDFIFAPKIDVNLKPAIPLTLYHFIIFGICLHSIAYLQTSAGAICYNNLILAKLFHWVGLSPFFFRPFDYGISEYFFCNTPTNFNRFFTIT